MALAGSLAACEAHGARSGVVGQGARGSSTWVHPRPSLQTSSVRPDAKATRPGRQLVGGGGGGEGRKASCQMRCTQDSAGVEWRLYDIMIVVFNCVHCLTMVVSLLFLVAIQFVCL